MHIPTLIPSLERRSELEQVYQTLYFDRDVYAADDTIYLCWPETGGKSAYNDVRLQNTAGFIYAQAEDVGKADETLFLGHPISLSAGEYRAFVMPRGWEYYKSQIRITHEIPAYVMGKNSFSDGPYGTQGERSVEALVHAAGLDGHLFAEIAKMALNWWETVEPKVVLKAVEQVNQRQAGSELTVLGLLGMLLRYGSNEKFPQWIKKPVKEALLNYKYSQDEPGSGCAGLQHRKPPDSLPHLRNSGRAVVSQPDLPQQRPDRTAAPPERRTSWRWPGCRPVEREGSSPGTRAAAYADIPDRPFVPDRPDEGRAGVGAGLGADG